MKRVLRGAFVGACLMTLSGIAIADKTYHSERLDLWLTDVGEKAGHPDLRSGHVVNIHPNGPVNGALERYMINGAKPNTSYQVVINGFESPSCDNKAFIEIPTDLLTTNAQGNAHGQAHFSRADIAGFSGRTLGVQWTLVTDYDGDLTTQDTVIYETDCTVVKID